jgi:magnesium transporter
VVELVNEFPEKESLIVDTMTVHRAVSVFKLLDINQQKDIIKELPARKTAKILNELPPDDRTDFFEELPKAAIRDLIKLLDPEERKITLSLLGYPDDSVGRMMTPDYVYVYPHYTVAQVLDNIRKYGKNSETIDVIYIIDELGCLVDDIRIRDLLLAKPTDVIKDIIDGRYVALNVYDDQEHASQVFKMNNRVAIPVVDDNDVLLGIVTIDDILWVTNEEFSEDMQKMGGTEALNEPYLDMSIFNLFKKRITWLVVLFLGEMLTATAMGYFEGEIAKVIVLTTFIPLILSSGGNTGSQASTLIIQAMSIGEITIEDWWKILKREIVSGLLLGLVLGVIGFFRVALHSSRILWRTLDLNCEYHWINLSGCGDLGNHHWIHVTNGFKKTRCGSSCFISPICCHFGGCNRNPYLFWSSIFILARNPSLIFGHSFFSILNTIESRLVPSLVGR